MLKVVGASWQKTRIGTYILIGAGLLVIAAFFVAEMDRPEYDGTYCATALWTEKVGFQIEYWKQQNDLVNIPKGAARICYKDSIYQNGWAQLEIETQRSYPDWVQAFGAGILEGSLTWNNVYNQWLNTIGSACDKDENAQNFCTWLRDTISANYLAAKKRALARADHDQYWHQIALYFFQLEGLETGFIRGATRARSGLEEEIPFVDFLLMNSAADIQDLKIYYENYVLKNGVGESKSEKNFFLPSATMFTKIFQTEASSGWQLLFGHSSAGSYSSMLRIQKRYKFRYHFSPDQRSNSVPGVDISFTGYPGILGSTDDFYIVKGRQVHSIVAGVAIKNENLEMWKDVDVADALPLTARVMAANRIAQSRRSWAKAMLRHPFTGNKQWVSVDLNKLNSLEASQKDSGNKETEFDITSRPKVSSNGLVWIVEQLPGRLHYEDVSDSFLSGNTTWVANGVPYFDDVLEASRVPAENFSLDLPSGENLTTLESIDKYLRINGFRGDLLGEEAVPYGNIDIKLFSFNAQLGMSDYHAFAGPIFMRFHYDHEEILTSESHVVVDLTTELEVITDRRPVRNDMRAIAMRQGSGPFKWSTVAERIPGVEHEGHPDVWDFDHVSPKWAW